MARPTPPNRREDGGREAEMLKRIAVLVGAMALLSLMALPAHAKMDHDGDADSDESTSYTEETDTNDGSDGSVDETTDNMHPSGKDRSVEPGKSGNQGKSESNPDDSKGPMRYEGDLGDDKPQGPGGEDLADQDGNNGCGNDDDFDDDNNGWCGKPRSTEPADSPPVVAPSEVSTSPTTQVAPLQVTPVEVSQPKPKTLVLANRGSTPVLGVSFSRSPKPTAVLGVQFEKGQALARTGMESAPMMLLMAMMFVVAGMGALKLGRRSV